MRSSFFGIIILAATYATDSAAATTSTFGDFGSISLQLLGESSDGELVKVADADLPKWWGAARCECGDEASAGVEITLSNAPAAGIELEVWVGSSCDEASAGRGDDCGEPVARGELSASEPTIRLSFDAAALIAPPDELCTDTIDKTRTLWVVYRESDDDEATASASIGSIPTDTKPPEPIEDVELLGAESRLIVRWDTDSVDTKEVAQIQALCSKYTEDASDEESKIGVAKKVTAYYLRGDDVCGSGTADSFDEAAPEFLCGTAAADASELEISLDSVAAGTEVRVRLVVADTAGNYVLVDPTPEFAHSVPSYDFWEVYQDQGGSAEGGCSALHPMKSGESGASSLLLAGIFAALLVLRRPHRGIYLGAVFALLSAGTAEAAPKSKWSWGIEVGPYYPGVDAEFTNGNTPFKTVFGDSSRALVQMRIDRYFAWPLGQLGVGAGFGYTQLSAAACEEPAEGAVLCASRSAVDDTKLLLLPMSLFAVYRFSWLADQDVLPVVPYARLGLALSYWKVSGGDGDTSADGLSASGLGALGMVVLVDEVEPQAKKRLQSEFGVSQVGLSLEVSSTELPLLRGSKQLRVGDTTWSAGVLIGF